MSAMSGLSVRLTVEDGVPGDRWGLRLPRDPDAQLAPETRHLNLRGAYWKVIEPGEVWAGAPIAVLRRYVGQ
jgi:hypothetical protein